MYWMFAICLLVIYHVDNKVFQYTLLSAMVIYILLDTILGIVLKRCVMPGLKCRACRGGNHHE